ncbi:flagellar hook-length control protein FliK [Alteromonas lipotrueiana]|uniref:flagellar hook-length control protein FliK n=1 Tax=Alteromonas lipotrueiana TaxID=2803815 RepID=UPI001C4736BA|nr:flagellar hook-length control protein FliK [Alteromonas lipotrueiana]
MMQQVAPKRQNVAALPIEIERAPAVSGVDTGFNKAMQQASEAKKTPARGDIDSAAANNATVAGKQTDSMRDRNSSDTVDSSNSENPTETSGQQTADKSSQPESEQVTKSAAPEDIAGKQADTEETDWLAYVDNIRNLDNREGKRGELDVNATVQPIASEKDTLRLMSDELAGQNHQLIFEAGDSAPKAGDEQKVTPIPVMVGTLAKDMIKQLGAGDDGEAGEDLASSEDIEALSAAIIEALNAEAQNSHSDNDDASETPDFLSELARFQQAQNNQSKDTGLLSGLITTELNHAAADAGQLSDTVDTGLIEQLSQLSVQGQQQMVQAISERITELAPAQTSEANKAQLNAAVIAGVKEMQEQVAQGHQPGFSVGDIAAQAMSESGIEVTPLLQQNIEQQVKQLSNIALGASSVAQAATAVNSPTAIASVDTLITENTQLRSEASSGAKLAEGLDSAVNIQQPDGQKQLAEKVRWMVNSRNMMAEIRLDPPEMGSMQVRVNVQGDAAAVSFVVQSVQTRDMLNEAEPRLREMLAEQGIELGESSVEQHHESGENDQGGGQSAGHGNSDETMDDDSTTVSQQSLSRRAQGGVDDYA